MKLMKNLKKKDEKDLKSTENALETAVGEVEETMKCETDGGTVHVDWDDDSPSTPFGQFVFFAHFLKSANLFDEWVNDCPIKQNIKNVNSRRKVITNLLGSYLLSTLAGHSSYAHVTSIRNDKVNPSLLGMTKIYSEDSVRRSFQNEEHIPVENWLKKHLEFS